MLGVEIYVNPVTGKIEKDILQRPTRSKAAPCPRQVIGSFAGSVTAESAVAGLKQAGFLDSTTVAKKSGDVSDMLIELRLHRAAAEHFGREVDEGRTLVIVMAEERQHVAHQHHLMDYAIDEMRAAGTL